MLVQDPAITSLVDLINEVTFQSQHKLPGAFVRLRKLSFSTIVGMILRMVKKSIQITCNWLADLVDTEAASKQAFSAARQKISPACFQELHADGLRVNYTLAGKNGLWKGYRLIAADGSTLRLPEYPELADKFGRCTKREGDDSRESPPMARISEYTDITNKLVLSGRIAPYATSEESLAKEQLPEVVQLMRRLNQGKLLFVYDRGYPSEEFIKQHLDLGVDFLFRLPRNFNKIVKEVRVHGDPETFWIREDWPMLRICQFKLSSGEEEILLTNLSDEKLYTQKVLSEVYNGRWCAMEEGYKRQKVTMQLENFSGKTVTAVEQEYWATLTVGNLIEMGCIEIEGYWIPGALPKQQVNRSVVFGSTRDMIIETIFGMIPREEHSRRFKQIALRSMFKARPGRNFSRAKVDKPKRHHVYRRSC